MSCTFWNMRRRMRKQLGIERAVKEDAIVKAEDMVNTHFVESKPEKSSPPKPGRKQGKK